jgi:hypothetical protein
LSRILLIDQDDIVLFFISFKDEDGLLFGGGEFLLGDCNLALIHQYLGISLTTLPLHIVVVDLRLRLFFVVVFLLLVLSYLLITQIDVHRIVFFILSFICSISVGSFNAYLL